MDFEGGRLIIEDTFAGGDLFIRGSCDVTDNSSGSAVIHDQTIKANMETINDGIKKASKLIPHNTNLS